MYDSGPSDAELEAIGLLREDVVDCSDFEIWPENWLPYDVFSEISSQWRIGMNGPTSLDHNVLFKNLDMRNLSRKKYRDTYKAVRIMEVAALKQMSVK